MAKIILVDDHKALRTGLALLIRDLGHEVIAQASNGKEFLEILDQYEADIILMDIQMPEMNGIDATRLALEKNPVLKIIILSMFNDEEYYNTLINMGAKGFILKESEHDEVDSAIKAVMSGKPYFSQELLLNLLKRKQVAPSLNLSPREKDILKLLCQGLSSAEIADKLFLSTRTVERVRSELLQKTDTSNSISLAIFAVKNGLVNL
jgi:DNA-binding NarL/FixJ family response regulator